LSGGELDGAGVADGDACPLGDGEVSELGRLIRQLELDLACGKASASASAM